MFVRPWFKFFCFWLLIPILAGCNSTTVNSEKITIGVIGYGEEVVSVAKYQQLQEYLAKETNSIIELEPAYNELQALEQIRRNNWSIVFAPPGLAAVAIGQEMYLPIFPLAKVSSLERSVFVVREDSQINQISQLANQIVALGQPGSAAGYYLPLYDLYGLTLAKIIFAPTPEQLLNLLAQGKAVAGALSENEFERYRNKFSGTKFRVFHTSRWIPAGVVLVGPTVERNQQENIKTVMSQAPSELVSDAGYVLDAKIPDYQEFIKLVNKVQPIETQVNKQPAVLVVP
jgi:phosphonate transport system substrate-binding protein